MTALTNKQKVTLTVKATNAGNSVRLADVPSWTSSDSAIVSIVPAADGLTAVANTVGPAGTVTVSVKANANLTGGARELSASLEIQVTAVEIEADTLTIEAGSPEPV